jgi:hypothetical protein
VVSTSPATVAVPGLGAEGRIGDAGVSNFRTSDLGGIFLGVVEELAVVPITSSDILALDRDRSRPGSASTWE